MLYKTKGDYKYYFRRIQQMPTKEVINKKSKEATGSAFPQNGRRFKIAEG
jgi:hypothetical protein